MISIHAPRTGSDNRGRYNAQQPLAFQSTLPARGATVMRGLAACTRTFQSTLPARGATSGGWLHIETETFQSTLPARGATRFRRRGARNKAFQSTLPARGATARPARTSSTVCDFNPRSPHGERLITRLMPYSVEKFQSTLPARGATVC